MRLSAYFSCIMCDFGMGKILDHTRSRLVFSLMSYKRQMLFTDEVCQYFHLNLLQTIPLILINLCSVTTGVK